jgi:hypothetical protein
MHPSRRQLLEASTLGVGSLALAWLLREEGLLASPGGARPELAPKKHDLAARRTSRPGRRR